nr:tyrosine-type recombinase/integrase [Bifidobacterium moukalabense]
MDSPIQTDKQKPYILQKLRDGLHPQLPKESRHAEWLLGPTTIQRQFRTARRKIGRDDVTFHSLRATHATMLMIEGGTLRETMDELGHKTIDVDTMLSTGCTETPAGGRKKTGAGLQQGPDRRVRDDGAQARRNQRTHREGDHPLL